MNKISVCFESVVCYVYELVSIADWFRPIDNLYSL